MVCQRSRCRVKLRKHAQEPVGISHVAGQAGCLASPGSGGRRTGTGATAGGVTRGSQSQAVSSSNSGSSIGAQALDSGAGISDDLLGAVDDLRLARPGGLDGLARRGFCGRHRRGVAGVQLGDLAAGDLASREPAGGDEAAADDDSGDELGANQASQRDHRRPAFQSRHRAHSA